MNTIQCYFCDKELTEEEISKLVRIYLPICSDCTIKNSNPGLIQGKGGDHHESY